MGDRPVFVVGAQRSGTTLVRLLLDAHPSLAIGPETSFVKHVADAAARATATDRSRLREDEWTLGPDEIEQELAAAWGRLFARHARAEGASRWGDKSPVHRYHGARIARLYPDAQMVAVVRHPAAVARSRERWGYEEQDTIKDWAGTVRHHLADARRLGPRRFLLLRYEDLLTEPRATLEQLLAFLREPWDDAVLDHTAGVEQGTVTDGGTVMSDPLDPSRAFAWREGFDADDLPLLAEHAAEEMALVGYAADLDTPVLPLPVNELTRPTPVPSAVGAAQRAVAQHGPLDLARRALAEVRDRGLRGAVRRWRQL